MTENGFWFLSVKTDLPTYKDLMNPVLEALKQLGGSGTIEEINSKVIEITNVTNEQLEVIHDPSRGSQTELEYRLGWTRTYLKRYGVLENSKRGVWALTSQGRQADQIHPEVVRRFVNNLMKEGRVTRGDDANIGEAPENTWRDELLTILLEMEPSAFERLIQRLLREAGFIQVEVTGKTGDGGIDGKGIMRLAGLLSFNVLFQCKRYKGAVTPSQVRDFRGAMMGRADKGLLITTGTFSKEATKEATRDGASAIDLIDGDQLLDKLKELSLGVTTETVEVEKVTVDREWILSI